MKKVIQALAFATHAHRNQRRKDKEGTPYINHPVAVASILSVEASIADENVIRAALLHDVLEDTDTVEEQLVWSFGPAVTKIVVELTDDKELDKLVRKQLQIEHAADSSYEAKLVKLADKIANLRDLANGDIPQGWSNTRVYEYFEWAKDVVDQLRGTHDTLETLFDMIYSAKIKFAE